MLQLIDDYAWHAVFWRSNFGRLDRATVLYLAVRACANITLAEREAWT